MTIKNLNFKTSSGTEYVLDGIIEHYPNSGFAFTKLTKINGVEEDNLALRQIIKHEDILKHIIKINNIKC